MTYHKNLKSLFSQLQEKVIPDVLEKEVLQVVQEAEQRNIQTKVFDAYEDPVVYERRTSGGLDDMSNMRPRFTSVNNGMQMLVENITKGKNDSSFEIAGLIEYGHDNGYGKYDYPYRTYGEPTFLNPRRFTYHTMQELKRTLKHVEAFRQGLKRHNIQTYK